MNLLESVGILAGSLGTALRACADRGVTALRACAVRGLPRSKFFFFEYGPGVMGIGLRVFVPCFLCLIQVQPCLAACSDHLTSKANRFRVRWDAVDFGRIFQALRGNEISLNITEFRTSYREEAERVLSEEMGTPVGVHAFIYGVLKMYGGWDDALARHGIDPSDLRKKFHVKSDLLIEAIKRLKQAGYSLSAADMNLRQNGDAAERLIEEVTGVHISSTSLYSRSIRNFGSWNKALEAAGIKPYLAAKQLRYEWDRQLNLELILCLQRNFKDMTTNNILRSRERVHAVLIEELDFSISAKHLYQRTLREFGGWKAALNEAREFERRRNLEKDILEATGSLDEEKSAMVTEVINFLNENRELSSCSAVLAYIFEKTGRRWDWVDVSRAIREVGDLMHSYRGHSFSF